MSKRSIAKFSAILARECDLAPHHVAQMVAELCRLGRMADTLAVHDCNGTMTPRREAIAKGIPGRVNLALAGTPFVAIHGGDPRGCVLKLKVPSGYCDDFGQTGLCVPY